MLAIAVAFGHVKILKIYVTLAGKIIILKGSDLTNLTKLNNVLSGIRITSISNTSSLHTHFVTPKLVIAAAFCRANIVKKGGKTVIITDTDLINLT
jgi:hypothetical protein